ncbi:hypothetical protein [Anaerovibrio sp. RM50]|uniref:hypothetical protein n=1 Tax=Anaerovibrio sp. RM50 TaxID=1200557 RepID=UPI000483387D|nr:hypothetical protein [Anaerovibrio sp. RM50]
MKFKKKLLAAGLACALALGTPGIMDSQAFAEEVQPAIVQMTDARTQLTNSMASLTDMDNGTLAFKVDLSSPFLGGNVNGTFDFVSKPAVICQGASEIIMTMGGMPSGNTRYNFYCRENGENMEFYSQNKDGSWDKYLYRTATDKAMEEAIAKSLAEDFPDVIKNVTLGQRQGAEQDYVVVMDGQKVKDYFWKLANLGNVKKGSTEEGNKLLEDVLNNMGDLECTITIDEVQHQFRNLYADLTPQIRAAARTVLGNSKEDSGMLPIIDASTVEFNVSATNYGAIDNVVIPEVVLNNAVLKEIPKVSDKKKETNK